MFIFKDHKIAMGKAKFLNVEKELLVRLISSIKTIIMIITISIWIGFIFSLVYSKSLTIDGNSMNPTLENGQMLFMDTQFETIDRYDIIVFQTTFENYEKCIKRVYGLPGETIQLKSDGIYINNVKIDDPYFNGKMYDLGFASNEIVLKENEYFVLGDNRNDSIDSRHYECGKIPRELITAIIK